MTKDSIATERKVSLHKEKSLVEQIMTETLTWRSVQALLNVIQDKPLASIVTLLSPYSQLSQIKYSNEPLFWDTIAAKLSMDCKLSDIAILS